MDNPVFMFNLQDISAPEQYYREVLWERLNIMEANCPQVMVNGLLYNKKDAKEQAFPLPPAMHSLIQGWVSAIRSKPETLWSEPERRFITNPRLNNIESGLINDSAYSAYYAFGAIQELKGLLQSADIGNNLFLILYKMLELSQYYHHAGFGQFFPQVEQAQGSTKGRRTHPEISRDKREKRRELIIQHAQKYFQEHPGHKQLDFAMHLESHWKKIMGSEFKDNPLKAGRIIKLFNMQDLKK